MWEERGIFFKPLFLLMRGKPYPHPPPREFPRVPHCSELFMSCSTSCCYIINHPKTWGHRTDSVDQELWQGPAPWHMAPSLGDCHGWGCSEELGARLEASALPCLTLGLERLKVWAQLGVLISTPTCILSLSLEPPHCIMEEFQEGGLG